MDNNFIRFPNACVHVVFMTDLTIASWFTSAAVLVVIGINIPVNDNPPYLVSISHPYVNLD